MKPPRAAALALVLVVTAAAFALRLWRLEFQSLWWDEGVSIYLAGAGVPALTFAKDFAVDLHPPGYHLLLALWRALFGPTVFSMRLLSVMAGTLTIPLVARLGLLFARADARVRVGLLAATLAAVSPIAVFYSQESRMYPFLPFLGALSLYLTLRVIRRPTGGNWLLWTVANLLSWYTYYYFGFWTLALT
ncbi:MAG TPA: glycosyltransferase family 39 protein, partial [Chloroflexota bacterium]|nr:glycosyltransferase family 39 protein [Chloroflexota bacterium]